MEFMIKPTFYILFPSQKSELHPKILPVLIRDIQFVKSHWFQWFEELVSVVSLFCLTIEWFSQSVGIGMIKTKNYSEKRSGEK